MNFKLTDEQKMVQENAREFANKEFPPLIKMYERQGITNEEYKQLFSIILPKFGENGFLGVTVPEKYGGFYESSGLDTISALLIMEEFAKVWGSGSLMFAVLNSLSVTPLLAFGTEAQKEKYLRVVAFGEKLGAYCLTEPNAGSDAGNMATTAKKVDNGWILNGSKLFITHASLAHFCIIFAKDSMTGGKPTAFIVDTATKGFNIGKIEHKAGLWASPTAEIILEDCFVPEENLLGEKEKGMKVALTTLDTGRLYIAAQALGLSQGAWDWTVKYCKGRKQFEKPIIENQGIYFPLADFSIYLDAARLLMQKAAILKDAGEKFTKEASKAKIFATENSIKITSDCMLFCGGIGYTEESPLPMFCRDAMATRIYEGANNIQRYVIAREENLTDKI
ncbi:MAG: acyl-CoA dehydrogenase family protein [Patescibacteria group bacterium]